MAMMIRLLEHLNGTPPEYLCKMQILGSYTSIGVDQSLIMCLILRLKGNTNITLEYHRLVPCVTQET